MKEAPDRSQAEFPWHLVEGTSDGDAEGEALGPAEGDVEGWSLGLLDGEVEGLSEGFDEGEADGETVGSGVSSMSSVTLRTSQTCLLVLRSVVKSTFSWERNSAKEGARSAMVSKLQ
jgi:hypothetical protein